MAQIDSNIALGIKAPQFLQPQDLYNAQNAIQQNNLQNELGQFKLQGARQEQADNQLYRSTVQGFGADTNANYNTLLKAGLPAQAAAYQKQAGETRKQTADIGKAEIDAAKSKIDLVGQAMGFVRNNPTLESANSVIDALTQQGVFSPEQNRQYKQQVAANPSAIKQLADQLYTQTLSAKDQLTKYETRNLGGTTDTVGINPVTGQTSTVNSVRNTQSPDNAASVAASYANASATRSVGQATKDAALITAGYGREQDLRKEFQALPEVKNYKQALPAFTGIKDAIKRDTTQSDINIVYGIAKLYDPNSVVREGEYATVANSPNIPDRIKGYANYLAGGGRLTKKVKDEIFAEAQSRMQSFESQYNGARSDFESIASRTGSDPTRLFPRASEPVANAPAAASGGAPAGWTVQIKGR